MAEFAAVYYLCSEMAESADHCANQWVPLHTANYELHIV